MADETLPGAKWFCINTQNGGYCAMYESKITPPLPGRTRKSYFARLVFEDGVGIREAHEAASNFCLYHHRKAGETGLNFREYAWVDGDARARDYVPAVREQTPIPDILAYYGIEVKK